MPKKRNIIFATAFLGVFLLGCGVSYLIYSYQNQNTVKNIVSTIVPVRENNFNYKFIYPLLSYNLSQALPYLEDTSLSSKLNDYVQTQYKNHIAESIGIYYRDLLTNQWAGVNYDAQYHPGSMMKVLIMMAYYREAQLDPSVMQKSLTYSNEVNEILLSQHYATPTDLVVGQTYNTKDLIKKMIEDSDNGAETLLLYNVDDTILNEAYSDLSLKSPNENTSGYVISAKQYAAFLRVLYNATYLEEIYSEEALSIMANSTYHSGIYGGIPNGVPVAQKFGEYVDTDAKGNPLGVELHNCGIVYAKSPYVICVMTKGQDENVLASVLRDVSGIVYNYVSK